MSNTDRLEAIKAYLAEEEKVKVLIPPTVSETSKGKVIRYFTGKRGNYEFRNGWAMVDKQHVQSLIENFPHMKIVEESGESK